MAFVLALILKVADLASISYSVSILMDDKHYVELEKKIDRENLCNDHSSESLNLLFIWTAHCTCLPLLAKGCMAL